MSSSSSPSLTVDSGADGTDGDHLLAGKSSSSSSSSSSSTTTKIQLDLQTLQSYASGTISYVSSRVTMDTVRPLPTFLGISGPSFCFAPDAFTPPVKKIDKSSPEKFKSRIRMNIAFFLSNYAVVTAGVACVVCLLHPGMLFSLGLVWALWAGHNFLISNEVVVGGKNLGTIISIQNRSTILALVTIVVITWKCLVPAISVVVISGIIIMTHAVLRDPKQIDHLSSSSSASARASGGYRRGGSDHDDSDDSGERSNGSGVLVDPPANV